jgi:hypothetical protein
MRKVALATAVLALVVTGCAEKKGSPQGSAPPAPPATTSAPPSESPTPSAVASASYQVGAVFYSDTFADTSKGWTSKESDRAKYTVNTGYATPTYTITAKKPDTQLFPHPEFRGITREQLTSYRVTATVQSTLAIGREDWMGVTCRDLDQKRYSFQLQMRLETHTVSWRIAKHEGSDIETLASGDTDIGGSAWEVAGTCFTASDGSAQLVMHVNGTEVGRVADADGPLAAGVAGIYLLARNGSATMNVLRFDVRAVTAT